MDNCSRCEITPQPHGASRGFVAVRYGAMVEGRCAERFFVGQVDVMRNDALREPRLAGC